MSHLEETPREDPGHRSLPWPGNIFGSCHISWGDQGVSAETSAAATRQPLMWQRMKLKIFVLVVIGRWSPPQDSSILTGTHKAY